MQALPKLIGIIKKEHIDLVIERGKFYGVGIFTAKITNRPCLLDFIDVLYSNWALRNADGILSYFTKIQVPAFISREKIFIVKMTVDIHKFHPIPADPELRRKYGIKKDDLVLIYIGGMYPWHGLETLIDTMDLIKRENLDVKALIVGMGEMYPIIKHEIKKRHLSDVTILTGRLPFDEIPKLLSISDIAVSLNTGDAVGFKITEYMASKIPMIATNLDLMPYIAPHKKVAYLIPPSNPNALISAIKELIQYPELRKQIGENARRKAELEYSWEQHIHNINRAFLMAIHQKKSN